MTTAAETMSISSKTSAIFKIVRPGNLLITALGVALSGWLARPAGGQWILVVLTMLAASCVAASGNAINDVFDLEIDRHNRPERPLPNGNLTLLEAKLVWGIGSISGIVIALFINQLVLSIVVFSVSILFLYSMRFKRKALIGNLIISGETGLALLVGAAALDTPAAGMIPAEFAFLATLAREIVKDVEDIEGDRKVEAMTLPVKYGVGVSQFAAIVSMLLIVVLTIVVVRGAIYGPPFTAIAVILDAALLRMIYFFWKNPTKDRAAQISTELKYVMLGGMVGIFLGSLTSSSLTH
ncbi:MAG: geranylgeranylglycerol-phosphate geranylgeranyltransferase [Ignavibacteriales bacterium]|nr:geranylgeranylglycerol-phosphate geranylgeranyltransferase [Ignavibacteriales bacterium]